MKGLGGAAIFGFPRSWTLGVSIDEELGGDGEYSIDNIGIVTFENGFITKFNFPEGISYVSDPIRDIVSLMDAVYEGFLTSNPFTEPTHFLTVSRTPDEKITEELKYVFGRTVRTYSSIDVADGGDLHSGLKISVEYKYDILGNVLEEIPPKKEDGTSILNQTKYTYNTLGQVKSKETPDGGIEEYEYNDDGSIRNKEVVKGNYIFQKIGYFYDVLGRLTRVYEHNVTVPGGIGHNVIKKYYDNLEFASKHSVFAGIAPNHLGWVKNLKGRLSGIVYTNYYRGQQTDVGEVFSYDDEGRLRFKMTAIEGIPGVQSTWYEYDLHGKVTADFCFYGGKIIKKKYTYDHLGRLSEVFHCVTQDDGVSYTEEKLVGYTYNDLGEMEYKYFSQLPDDYAVGYAYDIRDRLEALSRTPLKKGFGESISYDLAGNINNAVFNYYQDASDAATSSCNFTYAYDDVNRLQTATPTTDAATYGSSFTYDPLGRFRTKTEGASNLTGYEYYPGNNRLMKTSKNTIGKEYVYDSFGNLIIDYTKKMVIEYDWRNMPVAYRFYSDIPTGITKDASGTCTNTNLYAFMDGKVADNTVQLVSTVVMLYDADGNRIAKVDVKE